MIPYKYQHHSDSHPWNNKRNSRLPGCRRTGPPGQYLFEVPYFQDPTNVTMCHLTAWKHIYHILHSLHIHRKKNIKFCHLQQGKGHFHPQQYLRLIQY